MGTEGRSSSDAGQRGHRSEGLKARQAEDKPAGLLKPRSCDVAPREAAGLWVGQEQAELGVTLGAEAVREASLGQGDKQSQVLEGAAAAPHQRTVFLCAPCGKH